jgi:hypothetical protein
MTTKKQHRAGSIKMLAELYRDLNREFFSSKLPRRMHIQWFDLPGTIIARVRWKALAHLTKRGNKTICKTYYKPFVLQIDRRLKGRHLQKQVGMSMLHEMAHLKLGPNVDCTEWDGPFDKEMLRLARRGAFRLFW